MQNLDIPLEQLTRPRQRRGGMRPRGGAPRRAVVVQQPFATFPAPTQQVMYIPVPVSQPAGPIRQRVVRPRRAQPYVMQRQWQHDLSEADQINTRATGRVQGGGMTKLQVKNLHFSVNADGLKSVFAEFNPLNAEVIYDASDRSTGDAFLTFSRRSDAIAAMNKFQGALVSGAAIELSIASNVAVAPAPVSVVLARAPGFRGGRGRGRGGRGGRGGRRGGRREPMTEEAMKARKDELDMQLEKMTQ